MASRWIIILCLILEACSFRMPSFDRTPSSITDFTELKTRLNNFKIKVHGSEKDANCSKEQLEEDFKRLMASLKKDSCSQNDFTLDKEAFMEKNCPKIKTEGLFTRIVKKTIAEEKAKKPLSYFQNKVDPEFLALYREAQTYLKQVQTIIHDNNYSVDDRIELTAQYVENILLPIRDLIIIKRSYLEKENDGALFYQSLQPLLPESLVGNLSTDQHGLLTQGPNPATSPFYMEVKSQGSRNYQLVFSNTEIIKRDVLTLLKAPTAKNYVLAMKWMTLHMMLSQVYIYDTILETKGSISIPPSCQNQFNGNLPGTFKFKFEEGAGEQFLEGILTGHGLSFRPDDLAYLDYYIDNVNKDPTKDGYSGMIPFENYKNAKMSLIESSSGQGLRPQFDDVAHFQTIMGIKQHEAMSVFKGTVEKKSRATQISEKVTYAGADFFQNILGSYPVDEIAEIKDADGNIQQIYPGKQNLSPYLLELMKQLGMIDYSMLITERLKKKFVNKRVYIDFPSMYSSPIWRDWSLKLLADLFDKYKDLPTSSDLHKITRGSCEKLNSIIVPDLQSVCRGNQVADLAGLLSEFKSGEKYIPTRRLEEKKFKNIYPLLSSIWATLRNYTELLPEAKPFELNFLLEQMAAGNPWARLKFSYMVLLDQLEHQKEGIPPVYERSGLWFRKNELVRCENKNLNLMLEKIHEAGEVLGLHLPLTYNHADRILSHNEKLYIWKSIIEDMNHRNAQLFSVRSGDKDFYKIAEDLSYKTVLNEKNAFSTGISISDKARREIDQLAQTNEAVIGEFFLQLYQSKGDIEKQKMLFEKFSLKNGIDNNFNLKLNFLALDYAYKKPIYKDILKQAAMARKLQILSHLETFCSMDVNNPKEFKNIFYSASKTQNELNQMAGLPAVPEEVLNKVNSMTPDEFRDMWWGIGAGVAGMAAIVVGGACTVASGGICAPLGGAMAIAGVASLGIQVKLTSNELERKIESDISEKKVLTMEELGFANVGSTEEVHRSYAWTAFEAMSVFPLIGVATRSLTLGPKLVTVSARSIMQQTGKTAFKASAKSAAQEEEVRAAKYLLGIESVSKNLGLDKQSLELAKSKIDMIKKLYTSGEIDLETMLAKIAKVLDPIKRAKLAAAKTIKGEIGKVTVKESKDQIDQRTAQVVSQYFADNPKDMLRLIRSYSGERLQKALTVIAEVNAADRIANRIPVLGGMKDWYMRLRHESLARNAQKILRIEKELALVSAKEGELQKFILKNMDDLTDIFIEIPMKKREIPYLIQVQGMPDFNFFKGRRIPVLSVMSEGQNMKRIFTARARLVYESYKAQARNTLKLKRYVQSETTFGAFQSFQYSVAEMASRKTEKELSQIMIEYRQLEEKLAQKLYVKFKESGQSMDYKAFKSMVMGPANLKDKATAEALWESIPADELMGMKEVGLFAHRAVQELSNYNNVDSFQRYLNALKILVINRNPAVLEIM